MSYDGTPEVVALVPHTINAMAREQTEQIIKWFAAGHSPRDVVDLAENEFGLIIEQSEARLLWTSHTSEIAEEVRMSLDAMRKNPYFEPSFVVSKLNLLLFGLEQMMENAIADNATGPATKIADTWLRVLASMDKYQPKDGESDLTGSTNFAELMDKMDPVDRDKTQRLLAELNEVMARQKRRTGD